MCISLQFGPLKWKHYKILKTTLKKNSEIPINTNNKLLNTYLLQPLHYTLPILICKHIAQIIYLPYIFLFLDCVGFAFLSKTLCEQSDTWQNAWNVYTLDPYFYLI